MLKVKKSRHKRVLMRHSIFRMFKSRQNRPKVLEDTVAITSMKDWRQEEKGDDRGWGGWMASPTQWTWVWVNSGSWWWTGRPGMLWFMGSQRVRHDWATELNWTELRVGIDQNEQERKQWECCKVFYISMWLVITHTHTHTHTHTYMCACMCIHHIASVKPVCYNCFKCKKLLYICPLFLMAMRPQYFLM